jgi:glycosidase
MRLTRTSDLWWRNAVIYCLDVETYQDSNGDGHGDFHGLIQRIDHLHRLGVTCVWLMPYYPSPDRDDGYDITDYYGVDARLGSHGGFVEFVRTARDRGMRVIADLVVNHTSDQHPWFQSACSSPDSPYRDWYVWVDEPPADGPQGIAFPDQETSVWTYDEGRRPVLPASVLQVPTRPQRGQPAGARRDCADDRLLAAARAVRVPGRRCPVPAGDHRAGRRGAASGPARLPRRPAGVPRPALR